MLSAAYTYIDVFRPAPIMLEILPIILSRISQKIAHYSFDHYLLFS